MEPSISHVTVALEVDVEVSSCAVDGLEGPAGVATERSQPPAAVVLSIVHSHVVLVAGVDGGALLHAERSPPHSQGYPLVAIGGNLPHTLSVVWVQAAAKVGRGDDALRCCQVISTQWCLCTWRKKRQGKKSSNAFQSE